MLVVVVVTPVAIVVAVAVVVAIAVVAPDTLVAARATSILARCPLSIAIAYSGPPHALGRSRSELQRPSRQPWRPAPSIGAPVHARSHPSAH